MTILSLTVLTFYILFNVLTVLVQYDGPRKDKLKKLDWLNLIPNYKFFCPKPAQFDYHLYYRLIDKTNISDWKKIPVGRNKNTLSFLWNPSKKEKKAFTRLVQLIRQQYKGKKRKTYGYMYMILLDLVRRQAAARNGSNIQFKITYKQNLQPTSVERDFYTSIVHKR